MSLTAMLALPDPRITLAGAWQACGRGKADRGKAKTIVRKPSLEITIANSLISSMDNLRPGSGWS